MPYFNKETMLTTRRKQNIDKKTFYWLKNEQKIFTKKFSKKQIICNH